MRFLILSVLLLAFLTPTFSQNLCGSSSDCLSGTSCCDGVCTSLLYDSSNCGACGSTCSNDQVCSFGACTSCGNAMCEAELGENCANCADCACFDGSCDETQPGSGNYACDNQTCGAVSDCPSIAGSACCSDSCTSLLVDPNNCGGCGNQCGSGEFCQAGLCQSCGNAVCEVEVGESCFNCTDCACVPGSTCAETRPGSGDYTCTPISGVDSPIKTLSSTTGLATTGSALEQSISGVQNSLTILILGVLAVIGGLQVMQLKELRKIRSR